MLFYFVLTWRIFWKSVTKTCLEFYFSLERCGYSICFLVRVKRLVHFVACTQLNGASKIYTSTGFLLCVFNNSGEYTISSSFTTEVPWKGIWRKSVSRDLFLEGWRKRRGRGNSFQFKGNWRIMASWGLGQLNHTNPHTRPPGKILKAAGAASRGESQKQRVESGQEGYSPWYQDCEERGGSYIPSFGIHLLTLAKHTLRMATHALVSMPEHTKEQNENRNTAAATVPAITATREPDFCK